MPPKIMLSASEEPVRRIFSFSNGSFCIGPGITLRKTSAVDWSACLETTRLEVHADAHAGDVRMQKEEGGGLSP